MTPRLVFRLLAAIVVSNALPAAETGDFDGDGRLSIADVLHARSGLPPAPGSRDGFDSHPCHGSSLNWSAETERVLVYLESLRRLVPRSLPHWLSAWPAGQQLSQSPLPEDDRAVVLIEDAMAPGGADDTVRVRLRLTLTQSLRAFSLLLEADGNILRVPVFSLPGYNFHHGKWNSLEWGDFLFQHLTEDVAAYVYPSTHLLTGGKIVLSSFDEGTIFGAPIGPGEISLEVALRLPKGSRAGRYALRMLPQSELVLGDGSLLAPVIENSSTITVERDVETGWDESLPPLRFDAAARRVLGKVEFRLADANGQLPVAGAPVASGRPGEAVALRVQMRTEVPLNRITVRLHWPTERLGCSPGSSIVFSNPEDGSVYGAVDHNGHGNPFNCQGGVIGLDGRLKVHFSTAGGAMGNFPTALFRERPLEHFKPLGEWVDVLDLRLLIPADAAGGVDVPLVFVDRDEAIDYDQASPVSFSPYDSLFPCDQSSDLGDDRPESWSYDVSYTSASVRIVGEDDPPPPVDAGVRILLGSAGGRPGDLVEVPIFASSEEPLNVLRFVLDADPDAIALESLDLRILSLLTGEYVRQELTPGQPVIFRECDDLELPPEERKCEGGVPGYSLWRATEARYFFLDLIGLGDFPGPVPQEIGILRARIRAGAQGAETLLSASQITWKAGEFDAEAESGGFLHPETETFAPASEVRPAVITILGSGFRRGDANGDGKVDLSDAVATLGHLFLGNSALSCLDSADTDDSGAVEITDAIFLLGALFLGTQSIPEPFPACGDDVARDSLGCKERCP